MRHSKVIFSLTVWGGGGGGGRQREPWSNGDGSIREMGEEKERVEIPKAAGVGRNRRKTQHCAVQKKHGRGGNWGINI